MAASRPLILARFARMGASRHESYGNDITPPSCSVAKVLPPRVSGKPRGAAPLGFFPPHSGVTSFTPSLRSGNVPFPCLIFLLLTRADTFVLGYACQSNQYLIPTSTGSPPFRSCNSRSSSSSTSARHALTKTREDRITEYADPGVAAASVPCSAGFTMFLQSASSL